MHISDVHDYSSNEPKEVREFLDQNRKEGIKGEVNQIIDAEFDRLGEYAAEYLSQTAADRAERFLERVLRGDADAAMSLLGDHHGGSRYRTDGYDKDKPWASLIHGRLFETNVLQLRREIVEAHRDLLESERNKDLQSIVDGLTAQVRELEADLHRCRDRSPY